MPLPRTPADLKAYVLEDPLCRRLAAAAAAHGRSIALVGGAVRDFLLGRPALDWDLVVPGDPTPLVEDLARAFKGPVVVLDAEFGVLRTRLSGGLTADLVKQQGESLEADLTRRDLALNALAVRLEDGQLLDPTGGLADLEARQVRAIARANLVDDPLRLVRVFRFAAGLDFAIEPATRAWIAELAPLAAGPAGERVLAELAKLVVAKRGPEELSAMQAAGVLPALFPGLAETERAIEVSRRLQALLEAAPERFGLPGRRTVDLLGTELAGERTRRVALMLGALFLGASEPVLAAVGEKLKWSARENAWVTHLVLHRGQALAVGREPDAARATYRYFEAYTDMGLAMALLALAEAEQAGEPEPARTECERLLTDYWRYQDHWATSPRLVNGRDLIVALELKPGPTVGRLIESLDEAQAVGEVRSREEALAWAARMLSERE